MAPGHQSSWRCWVDTRGEVGLHQGGPDHLYWEAESCGVAHLRRSSDVFEETEVLHNWSCHPFKVRGKKR